MIESNGNVATNFACGSCEYQDLLSNFTGLIIGLRSRYDISGQYYEKQRVLAYDASANTVSADLDTVKNDIIDCIATTSIKIIEIDLVLDAIQNINCAAQQSDRCPRVDALMEFKADER